MAAVKARTAWCGRTCSPRPLAAGCGWMPRQRVNLPNQMRPSALPKMEQLIVYRWNRHYPSDASFPIALEAPAWQCCEMTEFRGYSHEKITKEVYIHENNR